MAGPSATPYCLDLSLRVQVLQCLPKIILVHLFHPDVVQLQKIDVIGRESLERGLRGQADGFRPEILGDFTLAASLLSVIHEIVADFRRDDDLVALSAEGLGDEFLAAPVSIGIGGIEQCDAQIERLVHQCNRFVVRVISPPTRRNRPEAEPDLAHPQVRSGKVAILHNGHRMPPALGLCQGFRGSNRGESLSGRSGASFLLFLGPDD